MLCCGSSRPAKENSNACQPSVPDCPAELYKPLGEDTDFDLVQIQLVFRHGARTPLNFITGLDEATYDLSLSDDLPETMFNYQVVNITDGTLAGETTMEPGIKHMILKGGCRASVLTTVGQRQMFELGNKIRDFYLSPLGIPGFSPDVVRLRTTHVERTIKSLRCVLAGIFGQDNLNSVGPIDFPVKRVLVEDLFPNKLACPALRTAVETALINLDKLPGLRKDKATILRALGQPEDGMLDFACLRDDISSRVTHGSEYPSCLVPFRELIEQNAARTLHAVYSGKMMSKQTVDVSKLSIGRFLYSVYMSMVEFTTGIRNSKLLLYSAHDTTLAPMMEALGIWKFQWPDFASNIMFELYRSRRDGDFYLRVLYCGEPVRIRGQTSHLVSMQEVKRCFQPFMTSPQQFRKSCNLQTQ